MPNHIFIGVAWPYANGPLHAGHIAGAYLPADVFARYHRLKGNHVLMVSGSDCHGTPITLEAEAKHLEPAVLVRSNHESFVGTFLKLGISFDLFTQTYTPIHYETTSRLFRRLLEKQYLVKRSLTGAFSESLGRFLPDRYIEGTCPNCRFERARGDQCENCGRLHEPKDLTDPRSVVDDRPVEFRPTEHYLFDLPKLESALGEWLRSRDRSDWRTNTLAFTESWLRDGLRARAVTRDLEWGVPVPVDDPGFDGKRIYVWFDAVIGYLSASIEWAKRSGGAELWRQWWDRAGATEARSYYFIGKDNIPFHTIIWPATLLGVGELALPFDVPANEFLNLEGRKMSTSQGWSLTLPDVEDRYAPDQLRYYLVANAPEGRDANWSWTDFVRRNNDELVAVWGNLANRTLSLAYRNYGKVPEPAELADEDRQLLAAGEHAFEVVGGMLEHVRIRAALRETFRLAHLANKYLTDQQPWKLIGTDPDRARTVLYVALQTLDHLTTLLSPFLPHTSEQVHRCLGHSDRIAGLPDVRSTPDTSGERLVLTGAYATGRSWSPERLVPGKSLGEPRPLFQKLGTEIAEEERRRIMERP